ncbi:Uncharacterised protein [Serratia fonticola]|uniref:Uncharacterized protein n=1 Tax=Serratia fonticola TaxID=47917 RepID=A0A448S5V2_SERFO|nr:Uncharacterised protein [Serratia fonticola]
MIEIKLKKRRILASSSNTNEIYTTIILFSTYYALKGRCKSVDLEYLSFTFDHIINNTKSLDYDFVSIWDINTLIKPIILLLASYSLLEISYKKGKVTVFTTQSGNEYIEEMINENLFNEINRHAKEITSKITIKNLKNNKLLW